MFNIDEYNKISLTRGDTAYLTVNIEGYEPREGDILTLSVKKDVEDNNYVFTKDIAADADITTFVIEPMDTKNAVFGKYIYDVQLTTIDGEIFTIVEPNTFKITKEVSI